MAFKKLFASNLYVYALVDEPNNSEIRPEYSLLYSEKKNNVKDIHIESDNKRQVSKNAQLVVKRFNDFLVENGFEAIVKEEYNILMVEKIINSVNKNIRINGTEEELKYNEMINGGLDWFCNLIIMKKLGKGGKSINRPSIYNRLLLTDTNESIEKYKRCLSQIIKIEIYNNSNSFILDVDNKQDTYLKFAAAKSGIICKLPAKTSMTFSEYNIYGVSGEGIYTDVYYSDSERIKEKRLITN